MYKLLNRRWFRTQGGMKRKDMKEFFESRDMVPISIGRFFFKIYLKNYYMHFKIESKNRNLLNKIFTEQKNCSKHELKLELFDITQCRVRLYMNLNEVTSFSSHLGLPQ